MKRQIFIIISLVLLITSIQSNGQVLITKNDTIQLGQDSVAILTLPNYRGEIYWEQSLDNKNWVTSSIRGKDSLIVPLNFNANYRAKIVDGNCAPILSDTVNISVADSVKTVFSNGLIEIAYPDSVGEIVKFTVNSDTFSCRKVNNEYIFQGDIILSDAQIQLFSELKGGGISPTEYKFLLWPDNKVFYTISNSLQGDKRIIDAIIHWEAKTPLRFIKRESQNNYIEFVWDKNSCKSRCGMIGGKQEIFIAEWGNTGTVIHEIGHAVGLIHEQSRADREKFITVIDTNITEGWKDQFGIFPLYSISTKTFDFKSIMIYPGRINDIEVAINPTQPVMVKKSDGLPWDAQRNNLSFYDIEIIKEMYPPLQPTVETTDVSNITETTATGGGNVTADGGATVTARGICWSTSQNPTIASSKTTNGTGTGSFTSNLTGLTANTPYYVRAYATNSAGTAYGNEVTFTITAAEGPVYGSFTDPRDGHVYKTVTIGTQVWMAENLAYLPAVSPPTSESYTEPFYYVYGYTGSDVASAKQNANYTTYGVLYNWPAAKAACPPGWHLPTDAEWTALENYLIANGFNYDGTTTGNKITKSLAATTNWNTSSNTGAIGNNLSLNNKSGFSALPGGYSIGGGTFNNIGGIGYWWSSTENSTRNAWSRLMANASSIISRNYLYKEYGFSVRCVRD